MPTPPITEVRVLSFSRTVVPFVVVLAVVVAASGTAVARAATGADGDAGRSLVGQRLEVKAAQLLVYARAGRGSYIGSLLKGQTFSVRRLSRSGAWAYGVAHGSFNGVGWVRTSGLADAGQATRVGLDRESFDGSRGTQQLAGRVLLFTPRDWARVSRDGSPTARFSAPVDGACAPAVQVSVRAVVTSQSATDRARGVTNWGNAVLADLARPGGWLRVARVSDDPQGRVPRLYGIAIVRVARNRWADVRAFASFPGCTAGQVSGGPTAAAVRDMLQTARVQARVVRVR